MPRMVSRIGAGLHTRAVPLFAGLLLLLLAPVAQAQQASEIAGVVRDTSGAVLPGVTVEVSSPVLIEQVRTAFSDGQGRYNVVDLRPGLYVVTFSLTGFNTLRREGIELTAGFTSTVNADMQVGALEETITVTGAAPLVDTQNVRRQTAVSRDLLDSLPMSMRQLNTVVTLTPGFTGLAEVGGQYSTQLGGATATFHGKTGHRVYFDGMGMENMSGIGNSGYQLNAAVVQEMVLGTSGMSAETNADGAVINVVPKEGGNTYSGNLFGLYTNEHLESSNLNDTLRSRGLTTATTTEKVFDAYGTLGGPVKRDKLWFFATVRTWGYQTRHAGTFYNATQGTPFFTPDVNRPKELNKPRYEWNESKLTRWTWQATQRNKLNFTYDYAKACNCGSASAALAHEAAFSYTFDPNMLIQAAWTSPVTSRLLFEAGASATLNHWHRFLVSGHPEHISIIDQGLGITYNATATYIGHPNDSDRFAQRASVAYVTGSHNFKTGMTLEQGVRTTRTRATGDGVSYTFNNLVPTLITLSGAPWLQKDRFYDLGLYAQDQWRVERLTLNLGLRFDNYYGWVPDQEVPASRFLPQRNFTKRSGVPSWKDLNPRVGASYDLFGNSQTALKVALGRYVRKVGASITGANNPIETSVNSVGRSWNDVNRDYIPNCDLTNFGANGECGAINNQNFGKVNPLANRWADDVLNGFNVREYNWDLSTEVQHQLGPGISVTAGYYRNWYGNFTVTDNLDVLPADFDAYSVTAPVDPRLPGGGGYQVTGLYDLKPGKFGQITNLVTQASNFGEQKRVNDFINLSFNTRFGSGISFGGGVDTGRTLNENCFVVDSPQQLLNCRVVTPFKGQLQLKLFGSIPLPGDASISSTYQDLAGPEYQANYAATSAEIAPSLGRALAGGARTAVVPLFLPQTQFEDRIRRMDVRVTKRMRLTPRIGLQLNADAYNALNGSAIRTVQNANGPRWRNALQILDSRIFQFSGSLTY